MSETSCWPWSCSLPARSSSSRTIFTFRVCAADQFVDIDGARSERADDALALADVGEGRRRAMFVGGASSFLGAGGRPRIGASRGGDQTRSLRRRPRSPIALCSSAFPGG